SASRFAARTSANLGAEVERAEHEKARNSEPEVDTRRAECKAQAEHCELRRQPEVREDGHGEGVVRRSLREAPRRESTHEPVERAEDDAIDACERSLDHASGRGR